MRAVTIVVMKWTTSCGMDARSTYNVCFGSPSSSSLNEGSRKSGTSADAAPPPGNVPPNMKSRPIDGWGCADGGFRGKWQGEVGMKRTRRIVTDS